MSFNISNHARDQMTLRGIEENVVLEILNDPAQCIEKNDFTIYQSIIIEGDKQYLIRVFVNQYKNPPLVITVYKTSKISKYYEGDL